MSSSVKVEANIAASSEQRALLFLRIPEGAEDLPHLWLLETVGGMWVATFPKLVEEFRQQQAKIIRDMVESYNAKNT